MCLHINIFVFILTLLKILTDHFHVQHDLKALHTANNSINLKLTMLFHMNLVLEKKTMIKSVTMSCIVDT